MTWQGRDGGESKGQEKKHQQTVLMKKRREDIWSSLAFLFLQSVSMFLASLPERYFFSPFPSFLLFTFKTRPLRSSPLPNSNLIRSTTTPLRWWWWSWWSRRGDGGNGGGGGGTAGLVWLIEESRHCCHRSCCWSSSDFSPALIVSVHHLSVHHLIFYSVHSLLTTGDLDLCWLPGLPVKSGHRWLHPDRGACMWANLEEDVIIISSGTSLLMVLIRDTESIFPSLPLWFDVNLSTLLSLTLPPVVPWVCVIVSCSSQMCDTHLISV